MASLSAGAASLFRGLRVEGLDLQKSVFEAGSCHCTKLTIFGLYVTLRGPDVGPPACGVYVALCGPNVSPL